MEDMERKYRAYLKDPVEDPNFDIESIENFGEWAEEEIYWEKRYKKEKVIGAKHLPAFDCPTTRLIK